MGVSWYIVVKEGSAKVYKDGLALAKTGGEEYGRAVNISFAFREKTKKVFNKVRFEVSISLPPCDISEIQTFDLIPQVYTVDADFPVAIF